MNRVGAATNKTFESVDCKAAATCSLARDSLIATEAAEGGDATAEACFFLASFCNAHRRTVKGMEWNGMEWNRIEGRTETQGEKDGRKEATEIPQDMRS